MIVEGGHPSTQLWVLRDGALDLLRRDNLVTVMTSGELLGYASLLTRTAPAFTVRARSDCTLYCIPGELGIELLSREDGVRWLATTQRDALLYAARSLSPLPEVQTLPVTAVVRGAPQFCDPETTISAAAEIMTADGRSAVLVRTRDGLGIVTDVDLREKVVVGGVSRDAPVSAIMSAPVHTIRADTFAAEASIAMLTLRREPPAGARRRRRRGRHGLRRRPHEPRGAQPVRAAPLPARARDEDELVAAAGDIPTLFVDLLDARLDAPLLCRVLTILHDSLTARLLELAFERHGAPPVDYAWLVFGSAARHELTLASDQDNGLAYADTDDPAVDDYFRRVARGRQRRPHPLRLRARRPLRPGRRESGAGRSRAGRRSSRTAWRRRPPARAARQRVLRLPPGGRPAVRGAGADGRHARGARAPRVPAVALAPGLGLRPLRRGVPAEAGPPRSTSRRAACCPSRTWRATTRCRAASRSRRLWTVWPRSATSTRRAPSAAARCVRRTSPSSSCSCSTTPTRFARGARPTTPSTRDALRPLTRANLQEALREVAAAQTRFPRLRLNPTPVESCSRMRGCLARCRRVWVRSESGFDGQQLVASVDLQL